MAGKREFIVRKWAEDGVSQERIDRALELLVPTGNPFLDLCLWKGRFPSTKARFCTEELKVLPMMKQVFMPATREFDEVYSWQGVRRDESPSRADLDEIEQGDFGVTNFRPILDWTAEDCFAIHRKHGIKWNPLYEQGMGRVGCMPCVNCRKHELREIANRFPDEIQRVKEWESLVSQVAKRGSSTLFPTVIHAGRGNTDVDYERHGITAAVEWSRTVRGGRQFDLIPDDEPTQCSSVYGLCE